MLFKISIIIGTRPNIIKIIKLYNILKSVFNISLIHTGQHHSSSMKNIFFDELDLPNPDYSFFIKSNIIAGVLQDLIYSNFKNPSNIISRLLNTNSSLLGQIGEIMDNITSALNIIKPDLVIVVGDVTSTLAGALSAYKLNIPIAHIESGLRSTDLSMPEEVNRILVDHLSTYYFITEPSGIINLQNENYHDHLYLVGNTMIDTLKLNKDKIDNIHLNFNIKNYIVVTLHRPSNVDNDEVLQNIVSNLKIIYDKGINIIFPVHPRTKSKLKQKENNFITFIEPQGYLEFIHLIKNSLYVITDSGGIQEETTSLGIRCFTLRKNTERPITLIKNGGTNTLINDINEIEIIKFDYNPFKLWDGNASVRIRDILLKLSY